MSRDMESDPLYGPPRTQSIWQRYKYIIIGASVIILAIVIALAVYYGQKTVRNNNNNNNTDLVGLMSTANLMGHLNELQGIATNNSGNRAAGTLGYNMSIAYITAKLDTLKEYLTYEIQPFNISSNNITSTPTMKAMIGNDTTTFVYRKDFYVISDFAGEVSGSYPVFTVLNLGCSSSDYQNIPANSIAVVKRGNCTFVEKIAMAANANAIAVVVYNDGTANDRMAAFTASAEGTIPAFSASNEMGMLFTDASSVTTLEISLTAERVYKYTMNVIAETIAGRSDRVIVVGSHLDSVEAGPGINDNGSGSSLNMELALNLATSAMKGTIVNKVRFCWFGGEELGLLGSTFYVDNLNRTNKEALANISCNLNFDMVASPNYFRGIYNGTSDTHKGSGVIQSMFTTFFDSIHVAHEPTEFSGRSDYGPFLAVGIPAGGLFTGAEEEKTPEQRKMYGGIPNAAYDTCYHQACDTIDNINTGVYIQMAQAAAYVVINLAKASDLHATLNP